jgi:hypothetical protein
MTHEEIRECYDRADTRMKQTNGHSYITILKTRCQYCGRSPKQKGQCSGWFQTFLDCLACVLRERTS